MGTFALIQLIREKVKIPVIAAGGIATGKGIAASLLLGADAVQVGTAFLACDDLVRCQFIEKCYSLVLQNILH